ncbi:hypothetical protein CLV46_3143 [Diaminobutyricimonas aerilata]|uniref:Uncharacterized protein n=1 Tax=Diaminobutyricimonas aerilata TaxID=1162967 RepID=A0A2M9CNR5_9MICO|nr:hypothetical protein [Diaminobutyricimonas aerilata]PJJ73550.1 hypothetical protein CLV46_3143 [Diaminobutyricimonas aerilata]
MKNSRPRGGVAALAAATLALTGVGLTAPAAAPSASAAPPPSGALTNLAHLDFLLDTATPPEQPGHTTYRLEVEPELTLPWTYADARDGGTFERVGGGPLDPATGDWGQGAYNADDVSRAAVVYIRHWQQTGDAASRDTAYELLRSLAYLQTVEGPNAGNVVLWMQPDGELNPSAEPVELPDPSDSDQSYWLARTLWAFGEGFAAFADDDADFAAFLADRLELARAAVDRQALDRYGVFVESDGWRVPDWLIVGGADATAEAVLGLSAYVEAAEDDAAARDTLAKLAEGIAAMGLGDERSWPYGGILPWTQSRSFWHAWGSQMPAALAEASVALDDPELADPAVRDNTGLTPTLLTAGGPDNGWMPTPGDRVQIAYGVDSRVQSLLAVADARDLDGLRELAAVQAAWYFGANRAGEAMYDPATGVTFDGLQPDGSINRNSGAESTIHGLLSMLALDAHPDVAERARSVATVTDREGLVAVEAESATSTTGAVVTPPSAWTGESAFGGGAYLRLERGETATIDLGAADQARQIEPVTWLREGQNSRTLWKSGRIPIGALTHNGPPQGISGAPGVLLPQTLTLPALSSRPTVTVTSTNGTTDLDALILRPAVSRLVLEGAGGSTQLLHPAGPLPLPVTVGASGSPSTVRVYDASGELVTERSLSGTGRVLLRPGGFALVTR